MTGGRVLDDKLQGRGLTPREMQVLHGIAGGYSNAKIALSIYVSEDTVKCHARRLFAKLGARDRAHAVALGFRAGLLDPGSPPPPPPPPEPPPPPTTAERLVAASRLLAVCRDTEAAKGRLALSSALRKLATAVDRIAIDARAGQP